MNTENLAKAPLIEQVNLMKIDSATMTRGLLELAAPKAAARDSSGSVPVLRPGSARALIEARSAAIQAWRGESAAWWVIALSSLAVVALSLWR